MPGSYSARKHAKTRVLPKGVIGGRPGVTIAKADYVQGLISKKYPTTVLVSELHKAGVTSKIAPKYDVPVHLIEAMKKVEAAFLRKSP